MPLGKAWVWADSLRPNQVETGVPAKGAAFCGAGQNARLAAKLTGYKIDIKPESDPGELPTVEDAEVEIEEEPEESVDIEE